MELPFRKFLEINNKLPLLSKIPNGGYVGEYFRSNCIDGFLTSMPLVIKKEIAIRNLKRLDCLQNYGDYLKLCRKYGEPTMWCKQSIVGMEEILRMESYFKERRHMCTADDGGFMLHPFAHKQYAFEFCYSRVMCQQYEGNDFWKVISEECINKFWQECMSASGIVRHTDNEAFEEWTRWILLIGIVIIAILYGISLPVAWGNILHLIPYVIFIFYLGNLMFGFFSLSIPLSVLGSILGIGIARRNKTEKMEGFCFGLGKKSMCLHKTDLVVNFKE